MQQRGSNESCKPTDLESNVPCRYREIYLVPGVSFWSSYKSTRVLYVNINDKNYLPAKISQPISCYVILHVRPYRGTSYEEKHLAWRFKKLNT